jgi:hypothetical protein
MKHFASTWIVAVAIAASAAPQSIPVVLSVPAAPVPVRAAQRVALVYELHIAKRRHPITSHRSRRSA